MTLTLNFETMELTVVRSPSELKALLLQRAIERKILELRSMGIDITVKDADCASKDAPCLALRVDDDKSLYTLELTGHMYEKFVIGELRKELSKRGYAES